MTKEFNWSLPVNNFILVVRARHEPATFRIHAGATTTRPRCLLLFAKNTSCGYITIQVNSTFRARWLASSEVISQSLFTLEQPREKMASRRCIGKKVTLWSSSYSACVLYTKTTIHLRVVESGGYLSPLWWLIVTYHHHHHYYLYHYYYYHYIITINTITITTISLLLSLQLLLFYHDFCQSQFLTSEALFKLLGPVFFHVLYHLFCPFVDVCIVCTSAAHYG